MSSLLKTVHKIIPMMTSSKMGALKHASGERNLIQKYPCFIGSLAVSEKLGSSENDVV